MKSRSGVKKDPRDLARGLGCRKAGFDAGLGSGELGEACTTQGMGTRWDKVAGELGLKWMGRVELRESVGGGEGDAKATVPPRWTFAGCRSDDRKKKAKREQRRLALAARATFSTRLAESTGDLRKRTYRKYGM